MFVLGQILLFGLVAPVLAPFLTVTWRRLVGDPTMAILVPMLVLPLAFFFGKGTQNYLEANWPAVAYLALVPTMQRWLRVTSFPGVWRFMFFVLMIPALAGSTAAAVHLVHRLPMVKPAQDRVRTAGAALDIGKQTAALIATERRPDEPVYAPLYQWTSTLRWYGVNARQLPNYIRVSHFTLVDPTDPCQSPSILAWTEVSEHPHTLSCFPVRTLLSRFVGQVDGTNVVTRELVRFEKEPPR